jgi:hypothetical protein
VGSLGGDAVLLALGARVRQLSADRVEQRELTLDDVAPGGARGVLLVGHTFAPELSALIVIFGSVGPVISTRRSSRPGPAPATCHSASSRMWAVSERNCGSCPLPISKRRRIRSARRSTPAGEADVQLGEERDGRG